MLNYICVLGFVAISMLNDKILSKLPHKLLSKRYNSKRVK